MRVSAATIGYEYNNTACLIDKHKVFPFPCTDKHAGITQSANATLV